MGSFRVILCLQINLERFVIFLIFFKPRNIMFLLHIQIKFYFV